MNWKLVYLPEAAKDLKNLAGNQQSPSKSAARYRGRLWKAVGK